MIEIKLDLAPGLKLINADPLQLEQVMVNLGVNAKDAMPDGGKLIFKTENFMLDETYCQDHIEVFPGEYVMLTVSDNGHGMDKETLAHIFEPFFTTKETGKGTGLGLAMVYGIVKNHGGHITCYSDPGHGTVFTLFFPILTREDKEPEEEGLKEIETLGGSETILIVDDEEPLRTLGQNMLERYGYQTLTAESGEKAIEIYQKGKERIDAVILDLGMPGMGGQRCLQGLLKIDPEVKVIIASGYTNHDKINDIMESGAAAFISKPYHHLNMLNKLRKLLDQG